MFSSLDGIGRKKIFVIVLGIIVRKKKIVDHCNIVAETEIFG